MKVLIQNCLDESGMYGTISYQDPEFIHCLNQLFKVQTEEGEEIELIILGDTALTARFSTKVKEESE